ncbi:MAG TPA: M15 family metallopeptidase [Promineifilum sp.]|nr:M15 family metallopeptidase [Promineifilum sp.]HRO90225.1 M15 family metallopeptidase [Promineifilum sp.]HRQ13956.1 M15 family metallopeptidase [Promineifilum sp.]
MPISGSRLTGLVVLFAVVLWIAGCAPTAASNPVVAITEIAATPRPTARPPIVVTGLPPTATAEATAQAAPTISPTPLPPTAIPTATITPSPTPDRNVLCSRRVPDNGLLTMITLTYGLSRDYEPAGLVDLSGYLPKEVTLGYPTQLRRMVINPLVDMIADMQAAGLKPAIISGYRSFSAQAIARQKWLEKEPDRANILSAPPGFSEHQLGTVVDFGSPELAGIVGQEDIEFHTWFYKTSEGIWLLENAHKYGFTLSYPFEAFETTGFFYEPWHFRYVGVEMATFLHEQGISLTEHQLATEPPPCIPDSQ